MAVHQREDDNELTVVLLLSQRLPLPSIVTNSQSGRSTALSPERAQVMPTTLTAVERARSQNILGI